MTAPAIKANSTDPRGTASARPTPRLPFGVGEGPRRALRLTAAAIWPLHSSSTYGTVSGTVTVPDLILLVMSANALFTSAGRLRLSAWYPTPSLLRLKVVIPPLKVLFLTSLIAANVALSTRLRALAMTDL